MALLNNSAKTSYSRMVDLFANLESNLESKNKLRWGLTELELELEPGALIHAVKMAWKEAGRDGRRGHLSDDQISQMINDRADIQFTRNHFQAMFGDGRKLPSVDPKSREVLKYYQPIEQVVAYAYLKIALLNWTKRPPSNPEDGPLAAASTSGHRKKFDGLKVEGYSPCPILRDLKKIASPIYNEVITRMCGEIALLSEPDQTQSPETYCAALCFFAEWACELIYSISKSDNSNVNVRCCESPGKSIFGIYKSFGKYNQEPNEEGDKRRTMIVASDRKPVIMKNYGINIKYWPAIMYDGLKKDLSDRTLVEEHRREPTRMHLWVFQEPFLTLDENVVNDMMGILEFRSILTTIRSIAINRFELDVPDRSDCKVKMIELWKWLQISSRICIKRNYNNFYNFGDFYNGHKWNNGTHLDPKGTPSISYESMFRWSQDAAQDGATVLLLIDHYGDEKESIAECYSVDAAEVYSKPPAKTIREPSDFAAEGFRRLARAAWETTWETTGIKRTDALKRAREEGWYFLTPDVFLDSPFPLQDSRSQATTMT